MYRFLLATFALCICVLPSVSYGHEVYVLPADTIETAIQTAPFSGWETIAANIGDFIFWTFIAVVVSFGVFFISISRVLERLLDPFLFKLRRYAPVVSRVTIGLAFLAQAYYQAFYGPELSFANTVPGYEVITTVALVIIGVLITFGVYTRTAALAALGFFALAVYHYGSYMLTYTNYLGEIFVLLILGAHRIGVHAHADVRGRGIRGALGAVADWLAPKSFFILRVAFGISLLYASIYAKFLHNMLAFEVASTPLAGHMATLAENLGGFEPHFLVLGAGIIEVVIGLFFLLGIEIRFTSLFLEFWLMLSLIYFGEVVWPHLILIGIPIAFIFYGYDKYSLEGYFFKRNGREPVL